MSDGALVAGIVVGVTLIGLWRRTRKDKRGARAEAHATAVAAASGGSSDALSGSRAEVHLHLHMGAGSGPVNVDGHELAIDGLAPLELDGLAQGALSSGDAGALLPDGWVEANEPARARREQ